MHETALRALAKLEHVLPARLREPVGAVQQTAMPLTYRDGPQTDPNTLALLAAACRGSQVVTFAYRSRNRTASHRRVEPHNLVTALGRWYLVAYDIDHDDWRTFRLDRLTQLAATGRRVTRRELPAPTRPPSSPRSWPPPRTGITSAPPCMLPPRRSWPAATRCPAALNPSTSGPAP